MSDTVTVALISAVPSFVTSFIALLAYFQGRKNEKAIGATTKKVDNIAPIIDTVVTKLDENTKITEQTHDVVNGQSEALLKATATIAKAAGHAEGIAEEKERQKK